MANRNTRRQALRKKAKTARRREIFVIAEKRATEGQKKMLADFIKAAPTTDDIRHAKVFVSRTGSLNFLHRNPKLKKTFRMQRTTTTAGK